MATRSAEGSEDGSDVETERGGSTISLEENLELLTEKRASTRETALKALSTGMAARYESVFADKNKATLIESIKRALRKGTDTEHIFAANLASVLSITLGEESEIVFNEIAPVFKEVIGNTTNPEVICPVLEALAMVVFVAPVDEATGIEFLNVMSSVFESDKYGPSEQASSMRGWSLLATTVSTKYVHSICLPQHLSTFVTYLENDNVDVRVSAGDCIALLFEIARIEEEENFDISVVGQYANVDVEEMLNRLYELTQDKTKQRAKKDKIAQRAPFKDIINMVESGQHPNETLSFKFQNFSFDSWMKITRLNAIRTILGTGLQAHFEENDLLQEIFDVSLNREATKEVYTKTEKRLLFSPSSPFSKAKTKNLSKARSLREQAIQESLSSL